jgi:hypothetical protein
VQLYSPPAMIHRALGCPRTPQVTKLVSDANTEHPMKLSTVGPPRGAIIGLAANLRRATGAATQREPQTSARDRSQRAPRRNVGAVTKGFVADLAVASRA